MRLDSRPPRRPTARTRRERPIRHGLYGESYIGPVGWFLLVAVILAIVAGIIIELGGWNV